MRSIPPRPFSDPESDSPSPIALSLLRPSSCTTPVAETWSTNTAIHLDGSETFIDYTLQPTRQNTDLNFEASLDRFFSSGNYFTAFARARQITQTDFQTETDYEVGMRGNFRYGKIYIWPWLSWIERTYGPTKVNDPHIMLRIGRDLCGDWFAHDVQADNRRPGACNCAGLPADRGPQRTRRRKWNVSG